MTDLVALTAELETEDDPVKLVNMLQGLAKVEMTVELLRQTGIGRTLGSSRLRKHRNGNVARIASAILKTWKSLAKAASPAKAARPQPAPPSPTPSSTPSSPAIDLTDAPEPKPKAKTGTAVDLTDDADDDIPLMQRLKRRRAIESDEDSDDIECIPISDLIKNEKQKNQKRAAQKKKTTQVKKQAKKQKKIVVSSDDDQEEWGGDSDDDDGGETVVSKKKGKAAVKPKGKLKRATTMATGGGRGARWVCPECTHSNKCSAHECEACGLERPNDDCESFSGGGSSSSHMLQKPNSGASKWKVLGATSQIVSWLKEPGVNSEQSFGNAFAGSWEGRHGVSLRPPRGGASSAGDMHDYDMVESKDYTQVDG
jgi:hypothetical protein